MTFMVPINGIGLSQWLLQLSSSSVVSRNVGRQTLSFASFLCWHLWLALNELYFQRKSTSPLQVIRRAEKAFSEFQASRAVEYRNQTSHFSRQQSVWQPPPRETVTLNTNAAF
ncbi:hypothetical protein NE237_009786 [Protea cynaroides]|uniref:Uncharacterized protein n=1 Tax=Protea cynaroides TaxID=273540 RepID=A0A9Q0KZ05_9MAGN|nr:hypothetical protein NE237_009786 [Protea cynaroides]